MCGIVYYPHIYGVENLKMNKFEKMINFEYRVMRTGFNLNKKEIKYVIKSFTDSCKN